MYGSSDGQSCINELRWVISCGRVHVGTVGSTMNKDGYQCFRQVTCDPESMPRVNGAIGEDNVGDRRAYVPAPIVRVRPVHGSSDGGSVELVTIYVHALLYGELEWEERAKGLGGAVRGLVEGKLGAGLEHPLPACKGRLHALRHRYHSMFA